MLYIKVCKWEREFKYWPRIPENVVSTQKKVITFEKVIVWQFDRFCILGLLSGSLLTSIATMPIPPPTSTAVALLFDLYTNEILAIPIFLEFFGNREDYSPRIMKLWRVTFSVQSMHYCSPPSLSFPWTYQRTLTLSSPPSRVVLILKPSSPSSRRFRCFRGARGFVSPYKCYKYICTRAALHQVEDYAGTKKYYFVIVTFSLIFPPLPPL